MIKLHQFRPAWDMPNPSPFCMKVETYLRMAELSFTIVAEDDPRKAPKGKLPFIDDGGTRVADSAMIIDHLKAKYGDNLDAGLRVRERATGHMLRRALEEGFYFVLVYSRWIDDAGWRIMQPLVAESLPKLARGVVPHLARRSVKAALVKQGTGRHTAEEIYALGEKDLDQASHLLSDRPYFLGDRATSVDACAYAFLASVLDAPFPDSPLRKVVKGRDNLVAYCARMKARYYERAEEKSVQAVAN